MGKILRKIKSNFDLDEEERHTASLLRYRSWLTSWNLLLPRIYLFDRSWWLYIQWTLKNYWWCPCSRNGHIFTGDDNRSTSRYCSWSQILLFSCWCPTLVLNCWSPILLLGSWCQILSSLQSSLHRSVIRDCVLRRVVFFT